MEINLRGTDEKVELSIISIKDKFKSLNINIFKKTNADIFQII